MNNTVLPGVYIKSEAPPLKPLALDRRTVAGFVGVTEKGPLDMPVKLTSFNQFLRVFGGFESGGYLAHSIYGFFNSGGEECYAVRVAHQKGDNCIATATLTLRNTNNQSFSSIRAHSPGIWGNRIAIKLWHGVDHSYRTDEYDRKSGRWITVDTNKFKGAEYLGVWIDGEKQIRKVNKITEDKLYFSTPLRLKDGIQELLIEELYINVQIEKDKEREDFLFLSTNPQSDRYLPRIINGTSRFITIDEDISGFPLEQSYAHLEKGRNGLVNLTAGDFIGYFNGLDNNSGLGHLEAFSEIRLVAIPDVALFEQIYNNNKDEYEKMTRAVQQAMVDQCERLKDRFALLDGPDLDSELALMKWSGQYDTKYAAAYFPHIEILDPTDANGVRTLFIPPSGHVAGVYATADKKHGLHHSPANFTIPGGVGLKQARSDDQLGMLYETGLNPIKSIPGRGIKVWGARTLSHDTEWKFINVCRTFDRISSAIRKGTGWVVFEPNDNKLRKRVIRYISAFMIDLWHKGILAGTTAEDGFYVQCDNELNPPENIDSGVLTTRIGIAISKPAEFINITLHASKDDSNVVIED
ncbi:phage tail sheath C-terminal domain-containing protein [Spirochaeta cellobiosiphila]|uniref:phage tail sheath C-terminal domain-containing protein n=1 Tax=Spirochaeta cellobiosiphila TaxID=504483 RepID=UPI0004246CD1|nr:phage tail sheath C-terminal domain-containing protein [Spirochaeta cellobiosiphila]